LGLVRIEQARKSAVGRVFGNVVVGVVRVGRVQKSSVACRSCGNVVVRLQFGARRVGKGVVKVCIGALKVNRGAGLVQKSVVRLNFDTVVENWKESALASSVGRVGGAGGRRDPLNGENKVVSFRCYK
jgi:hypothetical protein